MPRRRSRLTDWLRPAAVLAGMFGAALGLGAAPQGEPALRALYDAHRWFALRDVIAHSDAPLFYRGAVEAAFDDALDAERDLRVAIQADPGGRDDREARSLLAALAFRHGRYREALRQTEALLSATPADSALTNAAVLLRALAQTPDQQTVERHEASGVLTLDDGNILLPVRVNGQAATFIFDTGANISVLSESEAARLGLAVKPVDAVLGSMAGKGTGIRVASGVPVVVGNVRVSNVAFTVVPDTQPPFNDLPPGERGVVGISVILAMQTLRWRAADRVFECGFDPGPLDLAQATVAFNQMTPLTQAVVEGNTIDLTLDTGAQTTDLYPLFASAFADLMRTGHKTTHELTGFDGSATFDSVTLPNLALRVGLFPATLRDADVLLAEHVPGGHPFYGNLGMDVLNQARETTLDFGRMSVTLNR